MEQQYGAPSLLMFNNNNKLSCFAKGDPCLWLLMTFGLPVCPGSKRDTKRTDIEGAVAFCVQPAVEPLHGLSSCTQSNMPPPMMKEDGTDH